MEPLSQNDQKESEVDDVNSTVNPYSNNTSTLAAKAQYESSSKAFKTASNT